MIIEADDNQQLKKQLLKQAGGVVATTRKGSRPDHMAGMPLR